MKIWPYDWEVKAVGKINSWHLGMCHKDKQLIVISTNWRKLQEKNVTTTHEVLHAIFHSYGIDTKQEEDLVNRISLALTQLLQDMFPWVDLLALVTTNGKEKVQQHTTEDLTPPYHPESAERPIWQPGGSEEHSQADWQMPRDTPRTTGG